MKRNQSVQRGLCAVAAASAVLGLELTAEGGILLNTSSSSAKITHYVEEDNPDPNAFNTKNVNPPPVSGAMPIPSAYQYKQTIVLNGGSSSASASVGAVTTPLLVGFTFASGTGLTQSDPTGTKFVKGALLKFNLNGTWDVDGSGFGPKSYLNPSFTLGGVIPPGDAGTITINMSCKDENGNSLITSDINENIPLVSLPYSYAPSPARLINGGVKFTGSKVKVSGTITFRVRDPGAEISFLPEDFEITATPPIYRFLDKSGNVSNAATWANEMGEPSAIPNAPGVRAFFGSVGAPSTQTTINLDVPVTIGMLDIDRPGMTVAGSSTLTFDTLGGNAVYLARNLHNSDPATSAQTIMTPIVLNKSLDMTIDSAGTVNAVGPISGTGGIVKGGLGNLVLSASNSFTGGLTVNSGTVTAGANGSLGNGTTMVGGGTIVVPPAVSDPFGPGGGTIAVANNGQVRVGTIPGNVKYNIGSFGCAFGSPGQLGTLFVGTNFFPAPLSMVGHEQFNTGPAGNPQGLFAAPTPTYFFGLSADFTSAGGTENITVGTASGGPWIGFGSDKAPRTFGGGGQFLTIAGQGQIVALGSSLTMKAPILGSAGSSLIKNGAGLVSIDSNTNAMPGPMEVASGPVAINGTWVGSSIQVDAGASLGGTGSINGSVAFQPDSVFKPGTIAPTANSVAAATTIDGPGTLHTGLAAFSSTTHLQYDLNSPGVVGGPDNDLLVITGSLILDGILDINGGLDFNNGIYTLMTFTGDCTNNGLQLGNVDAEDFPFAQVMVVNNPGGGGSVVIGVPEPGFGLVALGAFGLLARRSRSKRN